MAPHLTNNGCPALGIEEISAAGRADRKAGKEIWESIRFGIRQSSLGLVLVAASQKGLCAILLGNDEKRLRAELRSRFPREALIAGDAGFQKIATDVLRVVENPNSKPNVHLDLRGTEFQRRIWKVLCEIPAGVTATYKEIAEKVGMPATAQEVGEACAANALTVIVPCHRVIRTDGTLAGTAGVSIANARYCRRSKKHRRNAARSFTPRLQLSPNCFDPTHCTRISPSQAIANAIPPFESRFQRWAMSMHAFLGRCPAAAGLI